MSEELTNTAPETQPAPELGNESAQDADLYSIDDIAGAFEKLDGESPADGLESQEAEAGTEGEKPDQEPVKDEEKPEEAPQDVPMPEGWEEAMWQGVSPEVRGKIAADVMAHAKAIAAEKEAAMKAVQQQEQFAANSAAQIQQALATMKQIVDGEFAGVNWQALADTDPATYVRLQQGYNQRIGAIQALQQQVAAQMQADVQRRTAQEKREMDSEFAKVMPEIKAMIGASYNGKAFAADIAKYLSDQGVPKEAVDSISKGYELKMAVKAMLYDKIQAQRAEAAKKVAEAPKVQPPSGSAVANNEGRAARARALLLKNPNSTEALAALFEAM